MERFVKGDIVVATFPFSDLSATIKRPALVLANPKGNALILCQITAQSKQGIEQIPLSNKDLASGNLKINSYIRPAIITTIHVSKIKYKFGSLGQTKLNEVIIKVKEIIEKY